MQQFSKAMRRIKEVVKNQQRNPITVQDLDESTFQRTDALQEKLGFKRKLAQTHRTFNISPEFQNKNQIEQQTAQQNLYSKLLELRQTPYQNKFIRKRQSNQSPFNALNNVLNSPIKKTHSINNLSELKKSKTKLIKQDDLIEIQLRLKQKLQGINLKKIIEQGGKSIELLINQETRSKIDSFNQFYFNAISQGKQIEVKGKAKTARGKIVSRNIQIDQRIHDQDDIEMFKGSFLF
eukprot:403332545